DVRQKADAQLGAISQDGDAVADAEAAWNSYQGQFNGMHGQSDLSNAAKSLTGDNFYSAFALSQSKAANNAIGTALANTPSGPHAGRVVKALAASPGDAFNASAYAWGTLRSSRSFANALGKSKNIPLNFSNGTFAGLSTLGLGLTIQNAVTKPPVDFSSFQHA